MATINSINSNIPIEVALGGMGNVTLTDHGVLVGSGTSPITALAVATDGQLIIGSTGLDPVVGSLTSSGGTITFTPGAGTLNLETSGATANSFVTDSGTATPAAGVLTVAGGTLISTTGAGSTVTANLDNGTDGQLIIGNTAGSPAYASLTSTGGTVTFTAGAGTLNLEADGIDQINIFYVGKHGNDANDGLTVNKAFLTFGAAVAAASSGDVIRCFDAGVYVENITGVAGVSIHAPNAEITGAHTITTDNFWHFNRMNVATGTTGITMSTASQSAWLKASDMIVSGTGIGVLNTGGTFFIDIEHASVNNGFFLGSTTADETYIHFNEIAINGTGSAFGATTGGNVQIRGTDVENSGAGNGTVFTALSGSPSLNAVISRIETNILSNIVATSNVNLTVSKIDGTAAETGANTVVIGGASRIDEVPIGAVTPATGAFTSVTSTSNTAYAVICGGTTSANPLQSVASVGTAGQVLKSNGAGALPTFQDAAGLTWNEVTGTSQTMAVNNGYISNNVGLVTLTLPDTAALGTRVRVAGSGAGGWQVAQNAGETIHFLGTDTTTGVGGSLASTTRYDCVELLCIIANTDWVVISSVGNITIV